MLRVATLTVVLSVAASGAQPRYAATRAGDIVRLQDAQGKMTVSVLTTVSNAFEVTVNGHNLLRTPFSSVDEFRAKPGQNGIPLLAPFANRLDEPAFYANGRKYNFDMELGNVRGPIPIHGFLSAAKDWKLVEAKADARGAWVTTTLDVYRNPQWMQQFPFAHTLTMTYRLQDGALEVRTRIDNLSVEAMHVAIGFHPYFQLSDSPRDEWTLSLDAKSRWRLAPNLIPTGETEPIEQIYGDAQSIALKDRAFDDVFGDLTRGTDGRASMSVRGKAQQIDVVLGPNYRAAVVYSPRTSNFIALEPVVGITSSMNLAHKGLYKELQTIPPGAHWQESFWIRPRGFAIDPQSRFNAQASTGSQEDRGTSR